MEATGDSSGMGYFELTLFDKVDHIPRDQPLFWIVVDYAAKNGISGEAQSVNEVLGVALSELRP